MKINKSDLLEALEIVKPGLANKELIEQTTSFAFLENKIVTYNDSISISHPVENIQLKGAIQAEELYKLLKKINKETIKLTKDENELKLKTKTTLAAVRLQSEIVLPLNEINESKDWQDLPEEFATDLHFIKDSTSNDKSRRILTCVHIENNYMEASDGFQIMRVYMNEKESFPFSKSLIPAEVINEIKKINPTQVAQTQGWLHFKNINGTELSCRVLNDDFPEISNKLKVDGEKVVFPAEMDNILDRVMIFTKKDQLMDEEMQVLLKNNKLIVKGKNEYGRIKEKAKVKYEGKKASFWITPHLLQNILKRSNEGILGSEKIRFEGEDWEYVAVLRGE